MEELRNIFSHPELRTTKSLNNIDSAVRKALDENADGTIKLICEFMFSSDSAPVLQTFGNHTRDTLKKLDFTNKFETETNNILQHSVWEANLPNLTALSNAISICGPKFIFDSKMNQFISLLGKHLSESEIHNIEGFLSASKILESFFDYSQNPILISSNFEESDLFFPFAGKCSTFSILASVLLKIIKATPSFETTFSFIRTFSGFICETIPEEIIETLYSTTNESTNSLYALFNQYLDNQHILLIQCVIGRKLKKSHLCDYCFDQIKQCLSEKNNQISAVERIFVYNGMNQVALFVTQIQDFVCLYGESLLRDFDSSNNLITCALRAILQTILKHCDEKIVSEKLMHFIEPLSYNSKLKTWLFPQLLKHLDVSGIPNDLLLEMAQDPSVGNFVRKCVKCICKVGWKSLIDKCLVKSQNCTIDGSMIVLRPILESIFEIQNAEAIEYAFQTLRNTGEKIIDVWLKFECLQSTPRSKWKLTYDEIRADIEFAVSCGNWDVRTGAFLIFTAGGFPQNDKDIDFLVQRFEEFFFFDSAKHIVQITSAFTDFIDRINSRSKTLTSDQTARIQKETVRIACKHMIPSFISSHRQFALDIASTVLKKSPAAIEPENLRAIVSVTNDANASLSIAAADLIRFLCNADPNLKETIANIEEVKNLFEEDNSKKGEVESISPILSSLESVDNWEDQCGLFEQMNTKISSGKVPETEVEEAAQKLFDILVNTRVLAVTCRGQMALESISRQLSKPKLLEVLEEWTKRLMDTLDHFDMENMRRSAALPYLALSILRLNPPDIMQMNHTIFERLVNALVDVIKSTESAQEATHSLNMIRAVLTDKVTSPLAEVILPSVFESIFIVCQKIDCWDLTTAANLCIAAVIRKIKKKNISQEEVEQSLLLEQFFKKMEKARDSVIVGLKSTKNHMKYISLLTLSSFSSKESDLELQELVLNQIGSKDSRRRRLAARAAVSVTSKDDREELFVKIVKNLSHESFNTFHGQIMLLKEILLLGYEPNPNIDFPNINVAKIPPFIYDDIFYVLHMVNKDDLIPKGEIQINDFYFDQVSVFLHRPNIDQNLPVSALVALLWRLKASKTWPSDLKAQLISQIINKDMKSVNSALVFSGLHFLTENDQPESVDPELIVNLIKDCEFQPHIIAALFHLLLISNPSNDQLKPLFGVLDKYVFDLREEITPVHISIAELLPKLLFDISGYKMALRLLVDDVPKVRTLTMIAVSKALSLEFSSEIVLFKAVLNKIAKEDKKILMDFMLKWTKLICARIETDTHGEALTVIVDEFFLIRSICEVIKFDVAIEAFPIKNLLYARKEIVPNVIKSIEDLIVQNNK